MTKIINYIKENADYILAVLILIHIAISIFTAIFLAFKIMSIVFFILFVSEQIQEKRFVQKIATEYIREWLENELKKLDDVK